MEPWMKERAAKSFGGPCMSKFVEESERKRILRLKSIKSTVSSTLKNTSHHHQQQPTSATTAGGQEYSMVPKKDFQLRNLAPSSEKTRSGLKLRLGGGGGDEEMMNAAAAEMESRRSQIAQEANKYIRMNASSSSTKKKVGSGCCTTTSSHDHTNQHHHQQPENMDICADILDTDRESWSCSSRRRMSCDAAPAKATTLNSVLAGAGTSSSGGRDPPGTMAHIPHTTSRPSKPNSNIWKKGRQKQQQQEKEQSRQYSCSIRVVDSFENCEDADEQHQRRLVNNNNKVRKKKGGGSSRKYSTRLNSCDGTSLESLLHEKEEAFKILQDIKNRTNEERL